MFSRTKEEAAKALASRQAGKERRETGGQGRGEAGWAQASQVQCHEILEHPARPQVLSNGDAAPGKQGIRAESVSTLYLSIPALGGK